MSFIDVQNEFMAHIREPNKQPCPTDVEDRRMAIYRDLFLIILMALFHRHFQF